MLGAAPSFVCPPSEAILAPLAARQVVAAREADRRAAENDTPLAVAEAYFNVQRARGELAGAVQAERLGADLADRAEKLALGLAQPVEANRARAELARRRQAVEAAREAWETASADLNRLIRLPPAAKVEPVEPPDLRLDLLDTAPPRGPRRRRCGAGPQPGDALREPGETGRRRRRGGGPDGEDPSRGNEPNAAGRRDTRVDLPPPGGRRRGAGARPGLPRLLRGG